MGENLLRREGGGDVLHWGLIPDHANGGGVSQTHFTVTIFHFSNHEGVYTWR